MPLVFVHGVNMREGEAYDRELLVRNRLFTDIFYRLLGKEVGTSQIVNPFWGNLAPTASADDPFLPTAKSIGAPSLLSIAREGSIEEMLDIVVELAMEDMHTITDRGKELHKITDLAFHSVLWREKFSTKQQQLDWLKQVGTDDELMQLLTSEFSKLKGFKHSEVHVLDWFKQKFETSRARWQTPLRAANEFAKSHLKAGKEKIRQVATNLTAVAISNPARRIFHHQLSAFIGDSFFYFGSRGKRFEPGPVPEVIAAALKEAQALRSDNDPELIVVAHSMGGIVVMDLLSYFEPTLEVDLVVSVGSQFPLFADLDMFPGLFGQNRPFRKPENVAKWINIFDPNDFLGYSAENLFEDIIDVPFSSGHFGVSTHCDYFKLVSFFELMASSVKKHSALTLSKV